MSVTTCPPFTTSTTLSSSASTGRWPVTTGLDFAVEPPCGGSDVDVAVDAGVRDLVVEAAAELGAVVGLDDLDFAGQLLEHVVDEAIWCADLDGSMNDR